MRGDWTDTLTAPLLCSPGGEKIIQENKVQSNLKAFTCPICGNLADSLAISDVNARFLADRQREGNLDEVLTLGRIAWTVLPEHMLPTESRTLIDSVLQTIDEKVEKILSPLQVGTNSLLSLSQQLSALTQHLPTDVREEISTKIEEVQKQLKSLEEQTSKSSQPVVQQISELTSSINQLMNKPSSKGRFFENTLAEVWQATFTKDNITPKGGAGESDLIVVPYIGNRYGEKISVERKAGGQKYSRKHITEAIEHAKADGSKYAIVVYDSVENIPETLGAMSIESVDNIFVAVTDVQSGAWKIARYVIVAFQSALKTEEALEGVDLKEVRNIIVDMHNFNSQIEALRKKNNSTIKSCQSTRDLIDSLETLFGKYLDRLQLALNPSIEGQN